MKRLPSVVVILFFLWADIILAVLYILMMVELSMSGGLHVLKDLGHADWCIPQFLSLLLQLLLLSVIGGGLGIGVRVGHDEVLLGVEAGLVDVVDVGDRLGDLGTSVSKDHWLTVRMILVLMLI
jgi:hypothetical protein